MTTRNPNSWKTLKRVRVLDIRPWAEVWREEVELPDGKVIPDYYKIEMPDVSVVVALTCEKKVIVVRQYKHGVGSSIIGLPAGFVCKGERPLQSARRELKEETGFGAKKWTHLGSFVRDANRGSGSIHYYLALEAHQTIASPIGDLEKQEILFMRWGDLLSSVQNDRVRVIGLALAILLADQYLNQINLSDP